MRTVASSPYSWAVAFSVLFITSAAAQPFSQYFNDPPVPDSSQQMADRIVQSELPVVVDFWAPWCAPCRMLNPIIAKLEKAYKGRVLFMKVNSDYNRQLAVYLGVQGIPAVFFIKDKAVRQVLVGVRPEADYRREIDKVLALPPAKKIKKDSTEKTDTVHKNAPPEEPPPKSLQKKKKE
jgi:thioredoxin 1